MNRNTTLTNQIQKVDYYLLSSNTIPNPQNTKQTNNNQ